MSKGDRKREAAAIRREEEARRAQEMKKKRRRSGIIIACVAVVAVVGILMGVFAYTDYQKKNDPDYIQHNTMVATSDNYQVSQAMMTYFIRSASLNFANQYADYLDQFGLDTGVALNSQTCYFDKNITWFDYFAESTLETVNWLLGFAETARAKGETLTDEDKEAIEASLSNITPSNYGDYVTKEDIRTALELYYMADKQEQAVNAALDFAADEVEAYYNAHSKDFMTGNVAYYEIAYGEKADYADEATAKALAVTLVAGTNEEFEQKVKDELLALKTYTEDTIASGYTAECVKNGYAYSADDEAAVWLFADGRAVGDATVIAGESAYTVYRVLSLPARDESTTVDVRHILLTADTYGSDEDAKAKAEELLQQWKDGDATAESFGELAAEYTEDSNGSVGGLYEGVAEGQMVTAFNDWCFDTARKMGDTDIVKTNYGYHIMYFVGSQAAWYGDAKQAAEDAQYNEWFEEYLDTHHVTVDRDAVNALSL